MAGESASSTLGSIEGISATNCRHCLSCIMLAFIRAFIVCTVY